MYDLINKLITVTNKDKIQQEEQVMYEEHEDYDEYLHERDLFVLDDHRNVLHSKKKKYSRIFFVSKSIFLRIVGPDNGKHRCKSFSLNVTNVVAVPGVGGCSDDDEYCVRKRSIFIK
jgi:hypothetical protein